MARIKDYQNPFGIRTTGSYWRCNVVNINRRTNVITCTYDGYQLSGNYVSGHTPMDSRTFEFRGDSAARLLTGIGTGLAHPFNTGKHNFFRLIEDVCANSSGNWYNLDTGAAVFYWFSGSSAAND